MVSAWIGRAHDTGVGSIFVPVGRRSPLGDGAFHVALASIAAALSLVATGLVPAIDNNLFHLPILGRLYDLPQFVGDPFIQSLRNYSSGFWQALAGSDRFVDPERTLIATGVVSRFVAMLGFLSCARALGVTGRGEQAVFAALLVSCHLMMGYSYAGSGGLFVRQVSHSEFVSGLLLLSWGFAARGRFAPALALTGAGFFCNSFMGVWNLPPLAAAAAWLLRTAEIAPRRLARDGALGGLAFLGLAMPVVVTIVANPEFGAGPAIDYRTFLDGYWPAHFMIAAISRRDCIELALVIVLGGLSWSAIGRRSGPFAALSMGFLGLYALGVVAPYLTAAPLVLNLHLLRSGAELQTLASLGALSVVTLWVGRGDALRSRALAPTIAIAVCALPGATLPAILALAADHAPKASRVRLVALASRLNARASHLAVAVAVAASFALTAVLHEKENAMFRGLIDEWSEVAAWSRAHTARDAVFMTPTVDLRSEPAAEDRARSRAAAASAGFESDSGRRVWVDFKRGAAVMWRPSYYAEWRRKIDGVLRLGSLEERLRYASRNGVGYVVEPCAATEDAVAISFRTARLCVFASVAAQRP